MTHSTSNVSLVHVHLILESCFLLYRMFKEFVLAYVVFFGAGVAVGLGAATMAVLLSCTSTSDKVPFRWLIIDPWIIHSKF